MGDNDLREALRAMVTVVGLEAERAEKESPRTEVAAAIGRLLGIDVVTTAVRMPSAIGRAIPSDPRILQRLVLLLQQANAGAVSRLAQAIDSATLTLRPGFSQRVPHVAWAARTDRTAFENGDRLAPGRNDNR